MKQKLYFIFAALMAATMVFAQNPQPRHERTDGPRKAPQAKMTTYDKDCGTNVNWWHDDSNWWIEGRSTDEAYYFNFRVTASSMLGSFSLAGGTMDNIELDDNVASKTLKITAAEATLAVVGTELTATASFTDEDGNIYNFTAAIDYPTAKTNVVIAPEITYKNYSSSSNYYQGYAGDYWFYLTTYGSSRTGTFTFDKDAQLFISDQNEDWNYNATGGSITVSETDGMVSITGTVLAINSVQYTLTMAENVYDVVVELLPPPGVPDAGIEIIGTFTDWTTGVKLTESSGVYSTTLTGIKATDYFKFREAGDTEWKNEPMYFSSGEWKVFSNCFFPNYWVDGTSYGYPGKKYIHIDWSDASKYKWKVKKWPTPTCWYKLQMTDSYGDGWNGGYLTLSDGDFSETYTLSDGSYAEVDIPYYDKEMTFTWTNGSYADEVGFTILTSNGIGLFSVQPGYITSGLLYTQTLSPCSTAPNPYNPKNLKVTLTSDNKLRASWDAVGGASYYGVKIINPLGKTMTNKQTTNTSYLTDPLTLNGDYQVTIIAYDEKDMQLGSAEATLTGVDLPDITSVDVTVFAPSDCNMDVSGGMWLMWRPTGGDDDSWTIVPMTKQNDHLFTATIAPNVPSYDLRALNNSDIYASDLESTYSYTGFTTTEVCREIKYAYTGNRHEWGNTGSCDFVDHDYRLSNLQAISVPGCVTFSWEAAKNVANKYTLNIYNAADDSYTQYYITKATSFVWAVPDEYDGKEIYWTVWPSQPYWLPSLKGSNITVEKGTLSLVNKNVTYSGADITATWEFNTPSPKYLVEYISNTITMKREIVTAPTSTYTAPFSVWYYVCVTPLDASNQPVGGQFYVGNTYPSTDPAYSNITATTSGHHITFGWTTTIPKTTAQLYRNLTNGNSYFLGSWELTTNSLEVDVDQDGEYEIELYPHVEVESGVWVMYPSSWDESFMVLTTTPTFDVKVTATSGGSIYDYDAGLYSDVDKTLPEGHTFEVEAVPDALHYFIRWSDNETDADRYIYVDGNITLQALFGETVTLTIMRDDHGATYFEGDYVDYDYDSEKSIYYLVPGTQVTLKAMPDAYYLFEKWSDENNIATRTLTVTENLTLTPTFTYQSTFTYYDIDVSSEDTDKGKVNNVNGNWIGGTTLQVTATPEPGFVFSEWSDGEVANPRTIVVDQDLTIYAKFAVKSVQLTLAADGGGTTDPVPGTYNYDYGKELIIKALANSGYEFTGWSDANPLAERKITLTEDITLTANFKLSGGVTTFTFDFGKDGEGTVTADKPAGTYDEGTEISLSATAATGWHFVKWSNEATTPNITITLTANTYIKAIFQEDSPSPATYTFDFGKTGLGEVTANKPAGTYDSGESITLTATPATDWDFAGWVVNGGTPIMTNPLTVTLTENTTVTGVFTTTKKYKVTIKVGTDCKDLGKIKPTGYNKKEVLGGTQLEIEAIPEDGNKFVEWEEDGNSDEKRTITITQDTVLTAIFAEIEYYTLKVEIYPEEGGSVLFNGKTVNNNSKSYQEGTTVKLKAEPNDGYEFDYWEDGKDNISSDEYSVKMTKKKTVYANFKKKTQGLNDIDTSKRAVKMLINGEIYILRGDKIYTVQGQIVQ